MATERDQLFIDHQIEYSAKAADPAWLDRPSLHEIRLLAALKKVFFDATNKDRLTDSLPKIVTTAIARTVPLDKVPNLELAQTLFPEVLTNEDRKRQVRHFRNDTRSIKFHIAEKYIRELLRTKKIFPSQAGRLWYMIFLYSASTDAITDYFREYGRFDLSVFEFNKSVICDVANSYFEIKFETTLRKSRLSHLHMQSDSRQVMDFCTFLNWQESKIKRDPTISTQRLKELTVIYDQEEFDD